MAVRVGCCRAHGATTAGLLLEAASSCGEGWRYRLRLVAERLGTGEAKAAMGYCHPWASRRSVEEAVVMGKKGCRLPRGSPRWRN